MLKVAERLDGEHLRQICDLAKALSLEIVVGFAERGKGDLIHNSAAVISGEGEIISVYRKVHLRRFESLVHGGGQFTPGEHFEVNERNFDSGVCRMRRSPNHTIVHQLGTYLPPPGAPSEYSHGYE